MAGGPEQADAPPVAPTPEAAATFTRINGNLDYFFGHGLLPLSLYVPGIGALRAGKPRIVVGIGAQSAGQPTYLTGVALVDKLGGKARSTEDSCWGHPPLVPSPHIVHCGLRSCC